MALVPGTRLGPYTITAPLGAGGMGEVYKATDTRLDRTVAIKVLPEYVASDPDLRQRFEREAKTLAALSHPHICQVFDVGSQDRINFLVMEYLEGETLEQRLKKGALPLDQGLQIGNQIADALVAAHRADIVHRDLKPGNIMLTKSGAKLLDFGLAKTGPTVAAGNLSTMSTVARLTVQGTILGTCHYMAPEQIEGREADARTDLFAFGAVLFEMLAGHSPFQGHTTASVLGAILKDQPPPISHLRPDAPAALDRIVATCLAKNPEDRWQTARDLLRELRWVADATVADPDTAGAIPIRHGEAARRRVPFFAVRIWALAAVVAATVAGGLLVWVPSRPGQTAAPIRFAVLPTAGEPLVPNANDRQFDISPDGVRIVYASGASNTGGPLAIRELGQMDPTPLPGITSGRAPFFSPDAEWVAFFDLAALEFRKVSVGGGPSLSVSRLPGAPRGAMWAPDDTIVFGSSDPTTGLLSVPANGGETSVLTRPDPRQAELDHWFPSLLPDGAVLFTIIPLRQGDPSRIAVLNRATGTWKTILPSGSNGRYVETGHLLYTSGTTLFAVRFDPLRLEVDGAPIPVMDALAIAPTTGAAQYSISRTGTLVFMPPSAAAAETRSLVWVDRSGREEPVNTPPRAYWAARLSPDSRRAALDIRDREASDTWIWDFSRQTLTRLTFTPGIDYNPLWTPDGRYIVTGGSRGLFWRRSDGTGDEVQLTSMVEGQTQQFPMSFTPDGMRLLVAETRGSVDLMLFAPGGKAATTPLVATPAHELVGEISPDGRWLAYQSNESGESQIYVRPFPNVAGGRWQVSTRGGTMPAWAPTGRELFYLDGAGLLTSVPIDVTATFVAGTPTTVLKTRYFSPVQNRSYDVSSDGRRFLMVKDVPRVGASAQAAPQILVVLNWTEELKRLVPPR